ncbi:6-phosphogluconolactonase [Falsibacillus albus]|uniref:Glucosamine-6-phosphate deaminase n=1 Tax=Falsibacillus albus TaxID=2478915 RepID=A0A3L7JT25_9BACI|nr:6-phosphogluconolactonase [Falsibacillus albus]RLQ94017.1 glucosamine-6-phosphate deaminase [Falsibacillus albus]
MLKIFENEEMTAAVIAKEMKDELQKSSPVFCLASGSTPKRSYLQFAKAVENSPDLKRLKIVSLDEWVGIDRNTKGSCCQMLNEDLFSLAGIADGQIEFFDGLAADLHKECRRIDAFIENHPITFSLMGVGMNGHIGLNEPGLPILDQSSVIPLSETTKVVAQKYFDAPTDLTKGMTLSLNQIKKSSKVIVAITGERKADIVKQIFEHPEAKLPAQELLGYPHIDFYLDRSAAKYLNK